mmetsp:Transcript_20450/g.58704  ORF Transcript_20450/g.58704 Transcript_20450/m.58704 type:complete len:401 (+) Transcript_20450:91-1293(+)
MEELKSDAVAASLLPFSFSLDLLGLELDDGELPDTASVSSSGQSTSASSIITSNSTNDLEAMLVLPVVGLYERKKLPKEINVLGISKLQSDQVMARRRVESDKGITFHPEYGHRESNYYNADYKSHQYQDERKVLEERAVLIQSMDHYDALRRHPDLAKYFANDEGSSKSNRASILDHPSFGEQIIVGAGAAKDLCIGDVLEVQNGESTLKLEISSPRRCCVRVNKKHNSSYGMDGVRRYCNITGLGGIFARVLEEGELKEGMSFVRTANPLPKWTLEELSKSLYGEAPRDFAMKNWAYWSRSEEELEEVYSLEQLGYLEWKDEVEYILEHWSWYEQHRKTGGGKEPERSTDDGGDFGLEGITNIEFLKPLLYKVAPPMYRLLDLAFACSVGCCAPMHTD